MYICIWYVYGIWYMYNMYNNVYVSILRGLTFLRGGSVSVRFLAVVFSEGLKARH